MKSLLQLCIVLVLAACSSATSNTPSPAGTPEPSSPPPERSPGVTSPGRGKAISLRAPAAPVRYSISRRDSLELQLPGGATQVQVFDRTAYVTMSLTPLDGGRFTATFVLDSMLTDPAAGVPADSVAAARGTRWSATLDADGTISELRADRQTSVGDQVAPAFRYLFPSLPAGGARAGAEWSDSAESRLRADAFDVTEQTAMTYRARTADGGDKDGLALESSGTYRKSGTGAQYGQAMEMVGAGTRTAMHRLGSDGVVAEGRGEEAGEMTITVPAVGQTVPVRQQSTYRFGTIGATGR